MSWTLDKRSGKLTVTGSGSMWSRWEHSSQFWDNEQVKSAVISGDITSIGNNAFYDCRNLSTIVLPEALLFIGDFAFFRCPAINQLTLPDGVIRIGDYAFFGCGAMNTLHLPDTVTFIGGHCFEDCVNLINIEVPDSVSSIGERAFCGCMSLRKAVIPELITTIRSSTFSGCVSLNEISLPYTVTEIEEKAFDDCRSLKKIILPRRVKEIGSYAFEDCSSITEINLPASLKTLGDFVFDGCTGLLSIEVASDNSYYSSAEGVLFDADHRALLCVPGGKQGQFTIPDTVTYIGKGAFSKCGKLTEIVIPDSVTEIGESAFQSCHSLQKVSIPDSVLRLGNRAFNSCGRLNSVQLPDSVETIGDLCFEYCASIRKFILPDSVKSIGYAAFSSCDNLTEIYISSSVRYMGDSVFVNCKKLTTLIVADENEWYSSDNDVLYNRDKTILIYVPGSKSDDIVIPDTVNEIAKNAFLQCRLSRITIPASVVKIGEMAFAYCEKLKMITIPDSVETIEDSAFFGCSSLIAAYVPVNVEYMGVSVFEKCEKLKKIYFMGSEEEWNSRFSGDGLYGNVGIGLNKQVKILYHATPPTAVQIIEQPSDFLSKTGDKVVLSLKAKGSGLQYQWYYKKSGDHAWHRWKGHIYRSTEARVNSTWQGIRFRCAVSDKFGNVQVSDPVRAELTDVFAITRHPEDAFGHIGGEISFEVRAQGKDLAYQWFYRKAGQNHWSEWKGQTRPELVFTADASHNAMAVRCSVIGSSRNIILSNPTIVRLHDVLAVISQPTDRAVRNGETLSFSVDATGKGLTYAWYFRRKNTMWVKMVEKTDSRISITADQNWDGAEVFCLIRDSRGNTVKSEPAKIRVTGSVRITRQQETIRVHSFQPVHLSVEAKGSGLTYQWYFKKRGSFFWSKWAGCNARELMLSAYPSMDGMQVFCRITDLNGYSVSTDPTEVYITEK